MRPLRAFRLLSMITISAAGCTAPAAQVGADSGGGEPAVQPDSRRSDAAPPAALDWGACDSSVWPSGYPLPPASLQCTTVEVPFDHAKPDGAKYKLRVARQRSKAFPSGKAVFQLAGGPGGASVWQAGLIPQLMPKLLESFDLVYVDQRGTGGSGYLGCKSGYPDSKQGWIDCASQHADKDLGHYLTVDAAHDLEWVRKALGYAKIYLRGGSYGTRLALELIRQHESSLVAVVLDGLATPDWDYFSDAIKITDREVNQLITDCNNDPTCKGIAPNLAGDLTSLRQSLKQKPRPILVGGKPDVETELDYRSALHELLKDDFWRFRVPRAVHQAAAAGDFKLWNDLTSELWGTTISNGASLPAPHGEISPLAAWRRNRLRFHRGGPEYVAPGLFITGMCAEDLPNSPGVPALQTLAAQQDWGAGLAGSLTGLAEACASWKVGAIDASLRKPVQSGVKALLLSGGIDFVTSPEVGEHALKSLTNATHLVIPNMTHAAMRSACAASILTSFLVADGTIGAVDTSCLQNLPAPKW